jgi:trehalose/maltose hydrolase-like predicted phosphorylase
MAFRQRFSSGKDMDATQDQLTKKWSWDRVLRSPYIKQADVFVLLFL